MNRTGEQISGIVVDEGFLADLALRKTPVEATTSLHVLDPLLLLDEAE
jgi:uncharacterized protein YrrD